MEFPESVPCPHCGAEMKPPPKAKKKCRACGNYVRYKTRPETLEKDWVTEEEAERIDFQWSTGQGRPDQRQFYGFGLTGEEFRAIRENFERENPESTYDDVLQEVYRVLRRRVGEDRFDQLLRSHAWDAFRFGWGHIPLVRELHRRELKRFQADEYKKVEIYGGECSACRVLEGKQIPIEEALRTKPIPSGDCTGKLAEHAKKEGPGWCNTHYSPVYERDDWSQTVTVSLPPPPATASRRTSAGCGSAVLLGLVFAVVTLI